MPASLFIADKQDLTIAGIKYLLAGTQMQILAETKKFHLLWPLFEKSLPDLLILDHKKIADFNLDDLALLHKKYPSVGLLVISSDDEKDTILKLLEAGVTGYLTKDCSEEEIIMAINAILRKERFFCHTVLDLLIENSVKKADVDSSAALLTERETQIIRLIAEGYSTFKIAMELNLSPHTINSHRKNILKKLNIRSPAQLIIYAIDSGLIKLK